MQSLQRLSIDFGWNLSLLQLNRVDRGRGRVYDVVHFIHVVRLVLLMLLYRWLNNCWRLL